MDRIAAFVGHSFSEDDADTVRKFTDFFDHIADMGIGFSWDHAEDAEPKILSEKVLELIKDKNLFIGICTAKEKVIDPKKLKPNPFSKKRYWGDMEDYFWKTSDWIIQEIGLSIGRGLNVILLVEKGVRSPGGLQANLEYIPFERDNPAAVFTKILEMIKSLRPAKSTIPGATIEYVSPEPGGENKQDEHQDWLEPNLDWTKKDYGVALFHMINAKDEAGERRIYEAYLSTAEGRIEANKVGWAAQRECWKLITGNGGSLVTLEEMAKDNPENDEVLRYLVRGYKEYQEFEKAGHKLVAAAQLNTSPDEKLKLLRQAAVSYSKADKHKKVEDIIGEMKNITTSNEEEKEAIVLAALQEIAKDQNDDDGYLANTERLLEIRPADNEMRFSLAYKYSEMKYNDLALYHYIKIPTVERSSAAWNNIGVANAQLSLNGKAVEAYRKSEELGETLAMSNLGKKYIDAGFLKEAEDVCSRAIKIENYDKQVGTTIAQIKSTEEEEEKKQKKMIEDTSSLRKFFASFGHASAQQAILDHEGVWEHPLCKLRLKIVSGNLTAEGTYEVPESGWLSYFLGGSTAGVPSKPLKMIKYAITYEGTVKGYGAKCIMKVAPVETPKTTEESKDRKDVLMILSVDLKEIQSYEKGTGENRKFYVLKRID